MFTLVQRLLFGLLVIVAGLYVLAPTAAQAAGRKQVYAPPVVFGPWEIVASQANGPQMYTITVQPIGSTTVLAEVQYYDAQNRLVTKPFYKSTTISTGNSVSNIRVRLKGVPTGSSCYVDVN